LVAVVTLYQVVIVHAREPAWADEVETALREICVRVLRHDKSLIRLDTVEEAAATDAPTLVVCLGSGDNATSSEVEEQLERAREEAFAVVPVLRPDHEMHASFPPLIHSLNALVWNSGDAPPLALLRALGVVEQERRLFLSYRQAESSALALQLRRALSERSYDVFLDRFSVPPGADFQRRIDIELADKAFVLLLESESAVGSDWVQHEVTYALSHRIAVLALALPDVDVERQFEVIDDAFRVQLADADVEGSGSAGVLGEAALQRALDAVEWRYAREIRRRRQQLLGSASDFLMRAGFDRRPLDRWALLASRGEERLVVLVTPSVPRPHDLRLADQLRQRVAATYGESQVPAAYVVHDVEDHDPEGRDLIEWIVAGRPLAIVALQDLLDIAAEVA
jgi:hypothetical protein